MAKYEKKEYEKKKRKINKLYLVNSGKMLEETMDRYRHLKFAETTRKR